MVRARLSAIAEAGEPFRPFGIDGPAVRAVRDDIIRHRYYARIAEGAEPDEDLKKLAERQRKKFNRAINAVLDDKTLGAAERDGTRLLWVS